jgi:proline iminopeptidase
MTDVFPPIEPHATGVLDVGDGHQIYWESAGNPAGRPVLDLHGGPGSGTSPSRRRLIDPQRDLMVAFDQRGCGRSRPLASDPDADLRTNTTPHLIADIERLRALLRIDRWTVLGLSWGCTLALAYAHAHPSRVEALVLGLVTTTSRREVDWITRDVRRIFPREWRRFAEHVPSRLREQRLVDAYAELLFDDDAEVRDGAALAWCAWEDAHVSLAPGHRPNPRFEDPSFRLGFARLVTHYWRHHGFLPEEHLLREAARLSPIPGVLVHGRYDVSSPLDTALRLSEAWRSSRLVVLGDAGHGGEALGPALIEALAEIRSPLTAGAGPAAP